MSDERGNRVLDAAGELLVAHGYRKVTSPTSRTRAGVGKGTVYLHWPSKLELFGAVLVREGVAVGPGAPGGAADRPGARPAAPHPAPTRSW